VLPHLCLSHAVVLHDCALLPLVLGALAADVSLLLAHKTYRELKLASLLFRLCARMNAVSLLPAVVAPELHDQFACALVRVFGAVLGEMPSLPAAEADCVFHSAGLGTKQALARIACLARFEKGFVALRLAGARFVPALTLQSPPLVGSFAISPWALLLLVSLTLVFQASLFCSRRRPCLPPQLGRHVRVRVSVCLSALWAASNPVESYQPLPLDRAFPSPLLEVPLDFDNATKQGGGDAVAEVVSSPLSSYHSLHVPLNSRAGNFGLFYKRALATTWWWCYTTQPALYWVLQ
jgi:hypothetical protein